MSRDLLLIYARQYQNAIGLSSTVLFFVASLAQEICGSDQLCSYSDLELLWNWPSGFVRTGLFPAPGVVGKLGGCCVQLGSLWWALCSNPRSPNLQDWLKLRLAWGLPAATFCSSFLLLGCTGAR